MEKSPYNKFKKHQKKLCSQMKKSKNANESIMVTTEIFTFFSILFWEKSFWTFLKCPKLKNVTEI